MSSVSYKISVETRKIGLIGKLIIILSICFVLIGSSFSCFGQEKAISPSSQVWFQYYNQLKLSDKFSILSDAGYRIKEGFVNKSQYLVRIGLGFNINGSIRISSGFFHSGAHIHGDLNSIENRPFLELLLKQKWHRLGISHRMRGEERFFRIYANDGSTSCHHARLRYRLLASYPVLKSRDLKSARKLSLNIADELFISVGKNEHSCVFDQNRFLVGASFQVNEHFTTIFWYNHQNRIAIQPDVWAPDHIFWFGVKHSISTKSEA